MKASYKLVRTTPAGSERSQGPVSTVRAATVLAAHVLADNANVPKPEAQRFSVLLANTELGGTACHEGTGYRFRIERADPDHTHAVRAELDTRGYGGAVTSLIADGFSEADAVRDVLGVIPRTVEAQIRAKVAR